MNVMQSCHGLSYRGGMQSYTNSQSDRNSQPKTRVWLCVLQGGKLGIALNIEYLEPWTDSPLDKAAAQTGLESALGWFADPLFFGKHLQLLHLQLQHHAALMAAHHAQPAVMTAVAWMQPGQLV